MSIQRSVALALMLLLTLTIQPWTTILTQQNSHLYSIDIDNYRTSLNTSQPVCMPVAPTVFLDSGANWFFQHRGGCYQLEDKKSFSTKSFTHKLDEDSEIFIGGNLSSELKTVILPIKTTPLSSGRIEIVDTLTGKSFASEIKSVKSPYQQLNFNVAGLSARENGYLFSLKILSGHDAYSGRFYDEKDLHYGLYIGN